MSEEIQLAKISLMLASVSNAVEKLPPTDFRDEMRIEIMNTFEILERYWDSLQ